MERLAALRKELETTEAQISAADHVLDEAYKNKS